MKNLTKWNWQCVYCGKRSIDSSRIQFDVPKTYNADIACQKCGKLNNIEWRLTVVGAETEKSKQ